jgi:hypothetical protein
LECENVIASLQLIRQVSHGKAGTLFQLPLVATNKVVFSEKYRFLYNTCDTSVCQQQQQHLAQIQQQASWGSHEHHTTPHHHRVTNQALALTLIEIEWSHVAPFYLIGPALREEGRASTAAPHNPCSNMQRPGLEPVYVHRMSHICFTCPCTLCILFILQLYHTRKF